MESRKKQQPRSNKIEFILGGLSSSGAGLFTNPLEVVKTRMQLQGELKAKGLYTVHYRHVFHAFYTIAKNDGFLALQNGLVPALWYQFFMNGVRLGSFQIFDNMGFTRGKDGRVSFPQSVLAGALAGCIGAAVGSPFYMVKTQLQAQATEAIAVGYQHKHYGLIQGLSTTYRDFGICGMWRGVSGALPRVTIGSAIQLSTFSTSKAFIVNTKIFPSNSWLNALLASMISGVLVTLFMTPFDVVSTRLYNQGIDANGRGLYYSGPLNCFSKIFKSEGIWGFYKGWGPSFTRLVPHTILSLVLWTEFRKYYFYYQEIAN
ncbi:solute carrier family 25 member 35-like [Octopus sinensis]|uniref:Solute carrier family 25 member 35-like n=1 Tax=Octopus sinensis TaxID=2607531 RepID=A0A6P7T166_9MOLL|nr:solute carrier family 25 member 35-like [Octopus sinensis]XP_036363704.1 solute carrier family 25 member 35-like [Octopus sinensis]